MQHRTLRTITLSIAVFLCVAVGTAVGVSLRRQQSGETSTAATAPAAIDPAPGTPGTAGIDGVAPPEGAAGAGGGGEAAVEADPAGDRAGEEDPAVEGEQAPPEGEERPPNRRPQPEIPDLELQPGAFDPPSFLPPANGDGNENQPAQPEPTPLVLLAVGPLGPGPIWETGGTRDCLNSDERVSTYSTVAVHEVPRAASYTVTATARAGNTTVQARVENEPGQRYRFRVWYSFPRGSVREPTPIAVTVTATNDEGEQARLAMGGRPGIGHRLMPFNSC